jgi:transposase
MLAKVKVIRKKRAFSQAFRDEVIKLFESGKYSILQLSRLYGLSQNIIYVWIYKYSTFNKKGYRIIEMKQSDTSKLKALQQRVQELERALGQKQIKIDFLEEMINVAQEELNIDIKKKSFTPPSNGSGKNEKS